MLDKSKQIQKRLVFFGFGNNKSDGFQKFYNRCNGSKASQCGETANKSV